MPTNKTVLSLASLVGIFPIVGMIVAYAFLKTARENTTTKLALAATAQVLNNCVVSTLYGAIAFSISKYAFKNNSHQNLMVTSIVAGSVFAFILLFQTADYSLRIFNQGCADPHSSIQSILNTALLSSAMLLGVPTAVGLIEIGIAFLVDKKRNN